MWRCSVERVYCVFSKDAEKPAEISLTCHKVTQTIFMLLLWLRLSPPCTHDCFPHFWNCPIMWTAQTEYPPLVLYFWPTWTWTFFQTTWETQIKEVEVDKKRVHPKLRWISHLKRKDSSTVQIELQRIKATVPLLHVFTLIFIWRNRDCIHDIPEKRWDSCDWLLLLELCR